MRGRHGNFDLYFSETAESESKLGYAVLPPTVDSTRTAHGLAALLLRGCRQGQRATPA